MQRTDQNPGGILVPIRRNRKTSLYMSDSLSKRLRHYCIENNTSMCAVINMAVSEFLSTKES